MYHIQIKAYIIHEAKRTIGFTSINGPFNSAEFNMFKPEGVCWIKPSLVQLMTCRLFDAKPLSVQVLYYC